MSKNFFLAVIFSLLSLLQISHPSRAASADKHSSQTQNIKPVLPYNFSVSMHGSWVLGVYYYKCGETGPQNYERVATGSTMNRCAKEGTEVHTIIDGLGGLGNISLYNPYKPYIDTSITIPEGGIKMKCRSGPARCDWTTPYEPQ